MRGGVIREAAGAASSHERLLRARKDSRPDIDDSTLGDLYTVKPDIDDSASDLSSDAGETSLSHAREFRSPMSVPAAVKSATRRASGAVAALKSRTGASSTMARTAADAQAKKLGPSSRQRRSSQTSSSVLHIPIRKGSIIRV
jgi:hypothetical protein